MPVATNIKFKQYVKAVFTIVENKGWECKYKCKGGTERRFDVLKDDNLVTFWCVHEAKVIYSDDLKKAFIKLGVTKEYFENLIKNKFKIKNHNQTKK